MHAASIRRGTKLLPPLLAVASIAAAGGCPLEVEGTWKLTNPPGNTAVLVSFAPDGWANVLNGPGEQSPGDIAAQVSYRAEPRQDPRRIDFRTRRGNDVFPPGTTGWDITAHADDSFTARPVDASAGGQSYWTRVQTHRYFLTFAARSADETGEGAAFVMWTTLDGSKTTLDALGTVQQAGDAHFGKVPDSIARSFATQGDPARDVMMRIELNEAEYRRTRAVYKLWNRPVARGQDANAHAAKLIDAVVQSVNRCNARLSPAQAAVGAQQAPVPAPLELVRTMRRANDRRHVSDKAFPIYWKPAGLT